MTPAIEFLWWEGCPSHEQALSDLRDTIAEVGLDPASVVVRHVGSEQQAEREGFVGSPTVRIDGRDLQPPEGEDVVGLTCRVYRLRNGRVSPTPDPADLRDALTEAIKAG